MPRLWMVPPAKLCRKHLLGEHHECHVFYGKLLHKHGLDGYIQANLFSLVDLWSRHEELVEELARRGMQHRSPFPSKAAVEALGAYLAPHGPVDRVAAEKELKSRCSDCFSC